MFIFLPINLTCVLGSQKNRLNYGVFFFFAPKTSVKIDR